MGSRGISLVLTIPSIFQIFRYAIGLSVWLCTMDNGLDWIDMLLNLVTVLAGNPIMFVFPGMAYLKNNPRGGGIHTMGAYFLILFCLFASGVGCLHVKNQIMGLFGIDELG